MIDFRRIQVLSVGLLYGCVLMTASVNAEQLQVSLGNGSLIGVEVTSPTFSWLTVMPDGNTAERRVAFSDVRELLLTKSPASEKLRQVKQLLQELNSEEFTRREEAERQLCDPDVVGDMASVIREERKNADLETSIRIERILWALNDFEQDVSDELRRQIDLDLLSLKDGTELRGYARGLELRCRYRDQEVEIRRDQILRIGQLPEPTEKVDSVAASVKIFNQHQGFYENANETVIDFETDALGNNLSLRDDLKDTFQTRGILTHAEQRGHVGSVRYPFKLCPLDVKSRKSGAVVNGDSRFKGIAGFTFCLPGQPGAPAGVHRFGVFIERVDHSRDIIVEAYGELGQILGMVEATDEKCVFAGFESNVPIARVRILQNPDLIQKGLGRDIDELYAFDNITFSQPVPIRVCPPVMNQNAIRLRNGDVISPVNLEKLQIGEQRISTVSPLPDQKQLELPINEVESILQATPVSSTSKTDDSSWMVMLKDQSIVRVQPAAEFVATDLSGLKIPRDQIVGLWPANQSARYPVAGDFDSGKPVVVFASCRIQADDFKMNGTKITWSPESRKTVQDVNIQTDESLPNEEPDPDLTPESSEFKFGAKEDLPSVWFEAPRTTDSQAGRLVLFDGQQWMLDTAMNFELENIAGRQAVVSIDGRQQKIPFSNIASIVFPISRQE